MKNWMKLTLRSKSRLDGLIPINDLEDLLKQVRSNASPIKITFVPDVPEYPKEWEYHLEVQDEE